MKFRSHKIPGIAKSICNAEQVIAYNFLFQWTLNDHEKNYALSCIQNALIREQETRFKKYDIDLIYHYVLQSYDRYNADRSPYNNMTKVFSSYEELAKVIYSDYFKEPETCQ